MSSVPSLRGFAKYVAVFSRGPDTSVKKVDVCLHVCTAPLAEWLRRPPRERKTPGSNPPCAEIFPWSSHTSSLKNGTPIATLPGTWRYKVSAGTGRRSVSKL